MKLITGVENISTPVCMVNNFDPQALLKTFEKMEKIMIKQGGVGLAANQVGIGDAIAVVKTKRFGTLHIINPIITAESEEMQTFNEGCLSIPGERLINKRPKSVTFINHDYNGNQRGITLTDFDAVVFSHEFEHLIGLNMYFQHIIPFDEYKKLKYRLSKSLYEGSHFKISAFLNGILYALNPSDMIKLIWEKYTSGEVLDDVFVY